MSPQINYPIIKFLKIDMQVVCTTVSVVHDENTLFFGRVQIYHDTVTASSSKMLAPHSKPYLCSELFAIYSLGFTIDMPYSSEFKGCIALM